MKETLLLSFKLKIFQGFFRRSIVKIQQNKEEYKCLGKGENCDIKPGKRSACPLCRYKKCLEVGMSQDGKLQFRFVGINVLII